MLGFAQTAQFKDVREFSFRAANIAIKHMEVFGSILSRDYLPAPMTWDSSTMKSTVAPFTDKVMMFHTLSLCSIGIVNYALALGASPRKDIAIDYGRLSAEIAQLAEDAAKIMIEHEWLEQPPQVLNHEALVQR